MNQWIKLTAALLMAGSFSVSIAQAQDSSANKVKIDDVNPDSSKAPGQDIDELITNKKMRAEAGSKSKYSIRTKLNYNGGTVEKPLAESRPNISGGTALTDVALLSGEISAKYAIDQKKSLMAGIGVRYITPFQGSKTPVLKDGRGNPKPYNGSKIDADNPYLIYQYATKVGGVQLVSSIQPKLMTQSNIVRQGYVSQLGTDITAIYDVGTSGLGLGLYTFLGGFTFSKYDAGMADLEFAVSPFVEYQLNDRLNLRTVFNTWMWHHNRGRAMNSWDHEAMVQSVGVGISVSRDVFLYPNVQFILDDIRADRTNVALNSAFNIF